MGAMHALVVGIIHTHLIFFSSGIPRRLKSPGKAQKAIRWATGSVFLGFATRLVLADQ